LHSDELLLELDSFSVCIVSDDRKAQGLNELGKLIYKECDVLLVAVVYESICL